MGQGLNTIICSLCCGLILLLAPCYAKVAASGAPEGETESEQAVRIVRRANELSPAAVADAAIGYHFGRNGFPRYPEVADAWLSVLKAMGRMEDYALLKSYFLQGTPDAQDPGAWALAVFGANSPLASYLRGEGLYTTGPAPDGTFGKETQDQRALEGLRRHKNSVAEYCMFLRQGLPIPPETERFVETLSGLALAEIVLYQATVPDKDVPGRDPEEIVRAVRRALDDLSVHAPWPIYLSAAHLATQRLLEKGQPLPLEDIAKAHQGDAQAMRATAAAYFCGARGHAHSPALGWAWTRRGALAGDVYCMLALTGDPHPPEALAWALLAERMGAPAVRRQARLVRESLEERISPEHKERALKRADQLRAVMPSK